MGGLGSFSGGMPLGGIGMVLFWGILIVGVVLLVRWFVSGTAASSASPARGKTALEILDERYARGEIGKEEFEQKKRDLKG